MQFKGPSQRGLRYWFVIFLLINIWVFSFQALYRVLSDSLLIIPFVLVMVYIGTAVFEGYRRTYVPRFPLARGVSEATGLKYEEVTFPSRDGLNLSGWYIPSRNGAAVILSHGFGHNRLGILPIAQILAQNEYGVLLYDMRAHGRSQGNLSNWGWREVNDCLGAVDFLLKRTDVHPSRIGAMGFSLGGQVTIRAAAQSGRLRGVAVDGAVAATLADFRFAPGFSLRKLWVYPWAWLMFGTLALLINARPPLGVVQSLPKISPRPVLFISTGKKSEQRLTQHFFAAARQPKQLFEIPEANHGGGLKERPQEYASELLSFFNKALQDS